MCVRAESGDDTSTVGGDEEKESADTELQRVQAELNERNAYVAVMEAKVAAAQQAAGRMATELEMQRRSSGGAGAGARTGSSASALYARDSRRLTAPGSLRQAFAGLNLESKAAAAADAAAPTAQPPVNDAGASSSSSVTRPLG